MIEFATLNLKMIGYCKQSLTAILVESEKTTVLRAMWTGKAKFKRFQVGAKLASALAAIPRIAQQRIWLHFAFSLRICLMIN